MKSWDFFRAAFAISLGIALISPMQAQQTVGQATVPPGLKILNETVPPGGMLQVKVTMTEPKPILKGGQKTRFASTLLSSAVGIHLFSPSGDASGVAVLVNGNTNFYVNSPLSSLGTNVDYPVLTVALPVHANAARGQKVPLTLDPSFSSWFGPSSQKYTLELQSGVMTVGGTLSISNVFPAAGVIPAGKSISIQGMGFKPNSRVKVKEATVATTQYVNANLLRITLTTATNIESRQIRVTNPTTNETTAYYAYQRPAIAGASAHALVARSTPLFSRSTWKLAYLRPVLSGTTFTALALQNLTASATIVKMDLLGSRGGSVVASQLVMLNANTLVSRDLREFFPSVKPATGTEVRVSSGTPIQVLGMLGDDATSTVLPVAPSSAP